MSRRDRNNPDQIFVDGEAEPTLQRALTAGASRMLLRQPPFMLKDNILNIMVADSKGHRQHGKQRQHADYKEVWDNPFGAAYTFCISSTPGEIMAQMVAMRLFLRATSIAAKEDLGQPLWHSVYGGYSVKDRLQNEPRDHTIPFLILGNVPTDATPVKIERLRDILTRYSNIPRVIVTSDGDPIEFMLGTLKMPVNFALHLGAKREKRY